MSKIWKTHLNLDGDVTTTIDTMGMVLRAGLDAGGVPSVWYWAPEPNHRLTTKIVLLGTGIETPEWIGGYIGSFVYGSLVLHAFEQQA